MFETFTAPSGKVLEVFHVGNSMKVRWQGGGELPPELKGSWTSFYFAKISILTYLDKRETRIEEKADNIKNAADLKKRKIVQEKFSEKQAQG